MAYVINPDGTVDLVEVEWDSNGNLRPKRSPDDSQSSYKSKSLASSSYPTPQKTKKKKVHSSPANVNVSKDVEANRTQKKQDAIERKKIRIITKQSIEKFFTKKKNLHQIVTHEDIMRASVVLKSSLLKYFMEKYEQYKEYCLNMGWGAKKTIIQKVKKKKKKKKNKIISPKNTNITSGNTIGDIVNLSTIKDSLADSDVKYTRSGKSRPPKYGYARDYFGRVQERDSFNEEKRNEFKQAQKGQSRYDYSSYDSEDDHDSYYDSDGYE